MGKLSHGKGNGKKSAKNTKKSVAGVDHNKDGTAPGAGANAGDDKNLKNVKKVKLKVTAKRNLIGGVATAGKNKDSSAPGSGVGHNPKTSANAPKDVANRKKIVDGASATAGNDKIDAAADVSKGAGGDGGYNGNSSVGASIDTAKRNIIGSRSGTGDSNIDGQQPKAKQRSNTAAAGILSEPVVTSTITIQPHRYAGVYIARGKNETIQLLTIMPTALVNMYREQIFITEFNSKHLEYRCWSPFKSKLAAALLGGIDELYMNPGDKVLCLGAGHGYTPSHIADIVGDAGVVYAVEHSSWTNRKLLSLGSKRPNIVPIIEDAALPNKYHNQVGSNIDTIFCDIGHKEQVRTLLLNVRHFLKTGGHFLLVVYAGRTNGSEGSVSKEMNFDHEIAQLIAEKLDVLEQVNLEPFAQGHALIVGARRKRR